MNLLKMEKHLDTKVNNDTEVENDSMERGLVKSYDDSEDVSDDGTEDGSN